MAKADSTATDTPAPADAAPPTIDLVLSNPWRDSNGEVHDVGTRVSVAPDLAERLITGGTGTLPDPKPVK